MCLSPIQIKNPKKRLRRSGGENYLITVPCGKCAECIALKRKESAFRAYYEAKNTIDKGGYIYFDTLTYNRKSLPKISEMLDIEIDRKDNFSCFRKRDLTLFFKLLRKHLGKKYDIKNNLKYFYTSEYGKSENYIDDKGRMRKGTKRPHYHILFFVKNSEIPKDEFIEEVNKCWVHGRTDYHQAYKHFFSKNDYTLDHLQNVCKYVSKYVTKDYGYSRMIENRIKRLSKYDISEDKMKEVEKEIKMFWHWSTNFGINGIEENKNSIYDFKIRMPDKDKIWDEIKLPNYYKRKIMYNCINNQWLLKDEYVDLVRVREWKSATLYERRVYDLIANIGEYIKENDKWEDKIIMGNDVRKTHAEIKNEIKRLLNGRSIKDFANYVCTMKGRIVNTLTDDLIDLKYSIIDNNELKNYQIYNNYSHYVYNRFFGKRFLIIGEDMTEQIDKLMKSGLSVNESFIKVKFAKSNLIDANAFARVSCVNDYIDEKYKDFDELERYLTKVMKPHNIRCQMTKEKKESDQNRLKRG